MPVSIFSETELARLASFPEEIPGDDLIRAFTLTGADRDLVAIRRGAANRLGLALQLCALRYLGFVPRNLSAAPRSAACFVADQLEVSPDEIQSYARREQTRFTALHRGSGTPRLLDAPVTGLGRTRSLAGSNGPLSTMDAPNVLFRLARERLRTERLVFPAPDRIVRLSRPLQLLPRVELAEVLIEVDSWTGFTQFFRHAGGARSRNPDLVRHVYAAIQSHTCGFVNPTYCYPGEGIAMFDWCQGTLSCPENCDDWWKGVCYVRMMYCPVFIIAFHYRCDPATCC